MRRPVTARAVVAGVLTVLLPAAAAAQAGAVRGAVRDSKGAPIHGAAVGIPGTTLFTTTDAGGRYRLMPVPPGETRVRAAAIGYAPGTATVRVAPGDSAELDFTLELSPFELAPLDVVSTKVPRFGERPATSVAQVTATELDRRAVNTVDEAIDRAAGVQLLNGQINIRGSTGYVQGLNARVLLLVDGVPLNQGDRGGINWDLLPVDQIERVDILKGAGSSLYGSAALGGVVNLTTRDVQNGAHARLRVTGGAYADPPHAAWRFRSAPGLQGGADLSGSYGTDRAGGRLAAGARHSDGYREQDAQDHWQVAARGRWQVSPRTRVDVAGAWAVDRYQTPLSWCNRGECDDRGQVFQPFRVDTAERGAHTDSRKGYAAAQVRTVASERFAWQARASWLRTHFTDWRPSMNEYGVANRFGAELRAEAHPDSARTVLVGSEVTLSDVASDVFGSHSQSELAAYGESEQRVAAARLSAGARLDILGVDGGSPSAEVSPRVGIVAGAVRASVGRGFRAPSMAERFVHTFAAGFEVVPNPNLRPETAWSVELGYTSPVIRFARLDAALFWTEARRLIEPTLVPPVPPDTGGPRIQLQNVARARLAGLDATVLAAPLPDRLTATLAYTLLYARRLATDTTPEQDLAFRPRHLLTLSADYAAGRGLEIGADFRYASRPQRIELEGFVDGRRVPVKVLDLRAGWTRGPVELRLRVANALNYIYNLVPETLAPVRTATVTATWTY